MNDTPHIWTRRPKIIEPRRELILPPRLAGYFRLQVRRPDGSVRHDSGWFRNLLLTVGLNIPGTGDSTWVTRCHVGTGNTAPDVGQTALVAQVATTDVITSVGFASNQTADRYCYGRTTFRFSAGAAAGNLAEIGISNTDTGTMLSRALILDGGGSPTTLTILSDEVLDATYEIRNYPPLTDFEGTMDIGGTTHDIVVRVAEVDSEWMMNSSSPPRAGWGAGTTTRGALAYPAASTLGTVLTRPSGTTAGGNSSRSDATYVTGSFQRDFSYTWDLTVGNGAGGIGAAVISCGDQASVAGEARGAMSYQISFDPPIPKDNTNNLVLNFRQTWAARSI